MNEMKELFGRVLDADAPRPVATRDDMLTVAHRAAARRRARHLTAACAGVALVVAAATAVPHWLNPDNDGLTTGKNPGVSAAPNHPRPTPSRSAPPVTPEQHAQKMLATLLGHVPRPFTTPSTVTAEDSRRLKDAYVRTAPMKQMMAITEVYRGAKTGLLSVAVTISSGAAPTGDLCVTAPASHREQGCAIVTATNGDRVRLSWRDVPQIGRIEYAARFYQGGAVVIQQTPSAGEPDSGSVGRILEERALADAAADPAFWPTNLAPFPSGS